jgi:hypothetical protein
MAELLGQARAGNVAIGKPEEARRCDWLERREEAKKTVAEELGFAGCATRYTLLSVILGQFE